MMRGSTESSNRNFGARDALLDSVERAAHALAAEHKVGQVDASIAPSKTLVGSTISVSASRDRLLTSEFSTGPSAHKRNGIRLVAFGCLAGATLAGALAAADFVAELSPIHDIWRQHGLDGKSELASPRLIPTTLQIGVESAVPRLIVQSSHAKQGEPAPLGLALEGQADGGVVIIIGLLPGMELSTGNSVSANAWTVLAADLESTWIGPPENFVGAVDLVAELRLSDDLVTDRKVIHLDWIPQSSLTLVGPQAIAPPRLPIPGQNEVGQIEIAVAAPAIPAHRDLEGIEATPPSLPTAIPNQRDQVEIADETASSLMAAPTEQEKEIAALPTSHRTLTQNYFHQIEVTASRTGLATPAPNQLAQTQIEAASSELPERAENHLHQTVGAFRSQPLAPNVVHRAKQRISLTRVQYQPDRGDITARPPKLSTPELDEVPIGATAPILPAPAKRQLNEEEAVVLLRRGMDLIASGDISAARLVLRRAADANDAEAALALGATYDPFVLQKLRVYGLTADPAMARVWYEKAKELGSEAATRRLEMLTIGVRGANN
jgi:hypothetical protein